MGSGAVSAGDEGRDTEAAAAEQAATAAESRLFSVWRRLWSACGIQKNVKETIQTMELFLFLDFRVGIIVKVVHNEE